MHIASASEPDQRAGTQAMEDDQATTPVGTSGPAGAWHDAPQPAPIAGAAKKPARAVIPKTQHILPSCHLRPGGPSSLRLTGCPVRRLAPGLLRVRWSTLQKEIRQMGRWRLIC